MANYKKSFNFRNGVQVDNDNFIVDANGLVGIGTSIPGEFLDVRGTAKVSGVVSTTDLFVTEDVFISGVSTLTVLDATSLNATGVVTAQQFIGDGSLLSGVVAVARTGWSITDAGISTIANVGVGTTNPVSLLQIGDDPTSATYGVGIDSTGQGNFTGIVTASSFRATGIVTGSSLLASGLSTFFSDVDLKSNLNLTGFSTFSNRVAIGTDTAANYQLEVQDNLNIRSTPTGIARLLFNGTGTRISYSNTTGHLSFITNGSERARFNYLGGLTILDGALQSNGGVTQLSGANSTGQSLIVSAGSSFSNVSITGVCTGSSFTGSTFTGYLSGIAQTAGFASTSFGLTGTPEITVGNIVGSSATVTALVVDNKIGVGSDTPAADIEVRKTSNAAVDVITSLSTARISVGQSVGTGNSSGVLSFNSGTLSLSNYDLGGVNVNLHSGSGSGTTESFKVRYDDNTKFETTYDGKVGVNRHGIALTRELEVGGNVFVSGYGQFSGIVTVGQGANQLTLGDGSALPISSSAVINITSGITTFNDVLVSRNFRVGTGIATLSGDTFVGGKLGVGTASDAGFLGAYASTIFGDFYSTGAIVARTNLGITTRSNGSLQDDPRTIPSGLSQTVPEVSYGNFQADGGSFTMFGSSGLFVPTVGVATVGYGETNMAMTSSDHDSSKYLTRIGINTYFARSVLDVGMASTTMSSFVILPSLNNEELDIVANLHTGNAGGNQNVNPVQSGFGTATAKRLLSDSGVPGGSVVYNNESRRLNVSTGGTVFCGVATMTQNQSGYDALALPTFNSTKRNLMSGYGNLPKGAIMYNTTTNKLNFWNGSAWEAVTSST